MKISKNCTYLYLLLGLFLSLKAEAQSNCFSADKTRVCVGETVNFTKCIEADGWSNVSFDFGDGNGDTGNTGLTKFQYNEPGTYYVYHHGQNNTLGRADVIGPIEILVMPMLPPKFELKTCAGTDVELSITDTTYEEFNIDWESDGVFDEKVNQGASIIHSYPSLSFDKDYTILVEGEFPSNCSAADFTTITVFPKIEKPLISVLETNPENQIKLSFSNLRSYLNYEIQIKKEGGAFQKAGDLLKESGNYPLDYVIENIGEERIATDQYSYCIRLIAKDKCNNQASDEACTIKLTAESLFDQNNLSWEISSGQNFDNFTIVKNNYTIQSDLTNTTFTDTEVKCNKNYCYEVIGVIDGASIHSNKVCVTGKSDDIPASVENITASVNNNVVEISWNKPSGTSVKEYRVTSSVDDDNTPLYTGYDSAFADIQANPNSLVACYSISYLDSCDNASQVSIIGCSILLKGEVIANKQNKLEWTDYQGWKSGVKEYILQVMDEEGNIVKETSMGISKSYEDADQNQFQVVRYRIKAVSNDDVPLLSFSNIFEIKQNFIIALPNAFTPNGDGLNDHFEVSKTYIKSVRMYIYNKWGSLIFEGESWDGMGQGRKVPEGVYLYYVEAEDETGTGITKRGTVTLIR
ncbi:MAG TPA: gliding motility-associated C-terminal domain-containing protein [Cytophagales bacterium]|nr:gliding motility-associated C-terminal domain-containing protein [Cytophagales bacterium]